MSDQFRNISTAEADRAERSLRAFAAFTQFRDQGFASHWEEIAELVAPVHRNTFFFNSTETPGTKRTDRQIDATGMLALSRFAAICDSLLTPRNMKWHQLEADDEYVNKDRQTRIWFQEVTNRLFRRRYAATANYARQNNAVFQHLGSFGTGPLMIEEFNGPDGVFRYRALPLGEVYIGENEQGIIDRFCRVFRLYGYQVKQKWPNAEIHPSIQAAIDKQTLQKFTFIQHVYPNEEYDNRALGPRGMKFGSCYVSIDHKYIMEEGGYYSFPMAVSRYDQGPGEVYGRSPAMMVLPALKTLNAEKRIFLKTGHRAADPVLLTADDGVVDFSLRPGAMNKGGMTTDGKPLIGVLPTGSVQITLEMMQAEAAIINDAFLVSLFQIMTESPQMTATEVIERTNEKGILLAPTVGSQQSDYLGPLIDREIDILVRRGEVPPMPPRLREAKGEYNVRYTSPLARAMRSQEAAGFFRMVEQSTALANATGDPSHMDHYDFDEALPDIAENIQNVPTHWMTSPEKLAARRKARAEAQARQETIQAAPAEAAMMKAQAAAQKPGAPK